MADAYKVVDIPSRVPNEAVFLEEQKAVDHITKFGGRLVPLVDPAPLRSIINEVHSWAVCGCIASADDMAQNLPRIVEITTP